MNASTEILRLEAAGFHMAGAVGMMTPEIRAAMDAEPAIITSANSGLPAYLNTYVDPALVEVIFAPNRAAQIVGEESQKGSWVTPTAVFIQSELTGEVSTYGDFNGNGMTGMNVTFPQRQNYMFQTLVNYGEQEAAQYGLARVDLAGAKRRAAATVMAKFLNTSYFSGIANLQNYGLLNDPALSAALTPAAGTWDAATSGTTIYNDILTMFKELQTQSGGLVTMEDDIVLAMPPSTSTNLLKLATVGAGPTGISANVFDLLKKAFPNLKVETAVQYATGSNLVQMIARSVEGQRCATCAYSERLRGHQIVAESSSFHQKFSAGTFGTVIFKPMLIAQMLGV